MIPLVCRAPALAGVLASLALPAAAQWSPDSNVNNPVVIASGTTQSPAIAVSDGAGGTIVVWKGARFDAGSFTFFYSAWAQRLDAVGNPMWAAGGVALRRDAARPQHPRSCPRWPRSPTERRRDRRVARHPQRHRRHLRPAHQRRRARCLGRDSGLAIAAAAWKPAASHADRGRRRRRDLHLAGSAQRLRQHRRLRAARERGGCARSGRRTAWWSAPKPGRPAAAGARPRRSERRDPRLDGHAHGHPADLRAARRRATGLPQWTLGRRPADGDVPGMKGAAGAGQRRRPRARSSPGRTRGTPADNDVYAQRVTAGRRAGLDRERGAGGRGRQRHDPRRSCRTAAAAPSSPGPTSGTERRRLRAAPGRGAARPSGRANGVTVCGATGYQFFPAAVSDGAGGVIVGWEDRATARTTCSRSASRARAPSSGPPTGGRCRPRPPTSRASRWRRTGPAAHLRLGRLPQRRDRRRRLRGARERGGRAAGLARALHDRVAGPM